MVQHGLGVLYVVIGDVLAFCQGRSGREAPRTHFQRCLVVLHDFLRLGEVPIQMIRDGQCNPMLAHRGPNFEKGVTSLD